MSARANPWSGTDSPLTVYMQGGLGNQLFCLSGALVLAARTHRKVVLDYALLGSDRGFKRSPQLGQSQLRESQIDHLVAIKGRVHPRGVGTVQRLLLRLLPGSVVENNPGALDLLGSNLDGIHSVRAYFQSDTVFQQALATGFDPSKLFHLREQSLHHQIRRLQDKEPLVVHVRRGDYVQHSNQRYLGLLSLEYFASAIKHAKRLGASGPVWLVSDHEDPILKQLQRLLDEPVESMTSTLNLSDDLDTYVALRSAKHIVVSNSSFSWWAARTGANVELVIAPDPWFRGVEMTSICPEGWTKLPAR